MKKTSVHDSRVVVTEKLHVDKYAMRHSKHDIIRRQGGMQLNNIFE